MKKCLMIIICTLITIMFLNYIEVKAEDYNSFQQIELENDYMKMLSTYGDNEIDDELDLISGRKFFGWKLKIFHEDEPCTFIADTIYSVKNDGESIISHTYKYETEEISKYQIGATGSIGVKVSGPIKVFKAGLDSEVKANISYTETNTINEEYDIEIDLNPGHKLVLKTIGEGKVSNGVAKKYAFFINTKKGGWETFIITTLYYEMEVSPLYEEE